MLHQHHHHHHHQQQLWGSVSGSSSSSSSSSSPCTPAREARVRRRFPPLCISRVSAKGSPSSSSPQQQQQQQQQQQPTAAAEATHITLSPPASTAKPSSLGVGSEEEEGVGPPGSRAGGSEGRAAAESIQGGGEGEVDPDKLLFAQAVQEGGKSIFPLDLRAEDAWAEFEKRLEADLQTVGNTLLALFGVIAFWRGAWSLLDNLFGDDVLGDIVCVLIGLGIILYIRLAGLRLGNFWPSV